MKTYNVMILCTTLILDKVLSRHIGQLNIDYTLTSCQKDPVLHLNRPIKELKISMSKKSSIINLDKIVINVLFIDLKAWIDLDLFN